MASRCLRYYEIMTPLLESALVEALRTEYISHVLLEYPIADLLSVRRSHESWTLHFDGEYRGAPLITEISTELPPEAWQSELGKKYILVRVNGGWTVYSRFYDLRAGDLPSTLRPVETPPSEIERRPAVTPASADMRGGEVVPPKSLANEPAAVSESTRTPLAGEHGQPAGSTVATGPVIEQKVGWTDDDASRGAPWARRAVALGLDSSPCGRSRSRCYSPRY